MKANFIFYKIKFVKIMATGGWVGPQENVFTDFYIKVYLKIFF
jgi:hypothetical protein